MRSTRWPRIVASGALWTVVYNFVWGIAWFAFMREEWEHAMSAIGRSIPFTPEVWFLWVVLTLPIGVVIMAFTADRPKRRAMAALSAAGGVWLILAGGTTIWGLLETLSMRVLALDACVNLVAMVAGALVGIWSQIET